MAAVKPASRGASGEVEGGDERAVILAGLVPATVGVTVIDPAAGPVPVPAGSPPLAPPPAVGDDDCPLADQDVIDQIPPAAGRAGRRRQVTRTDTPAVMLRVLHLPGRDDGLRIVVGQVPGADLGADSHLRLGYSAGNRMGKLLAQVVSTDQQ